MFGLRDRLERGQPDGSGRADVRRGVMQRQRVSGTNMSGINIKPAANNAV
jgi:hypothetical protein